MLVDRAALGRESAFEEGPQEWIERVHSFTTPLRNKILKRNRIRSSCTSTRQLCRQGSYGDDRLLSLRKKVKNFVAVTTLDLNTEESSLA